MTEYDVTMSDRFRREDARCIEHIVSPIGTEMSFDVSGGK
jgi:hypothetical protein